MKVAAPVHLLVALGQQMLGLDFIALKVPLLLDNFWMLHSQVVAHAWLDAGADRASAAFPDPGQYGGLPHMLVATLCILTQPPDLADGATGDLSRQFVIERGMPLLDQLGRTLCQGGLPCTSTMKVLSH